MEKNKNKSTNSKVIMETWKEDFIAMEFSGERYCDQTMRKLYATDASIYKEYPQAVAIPRNKQDIKALIDLVNHYPEEKLGLIPRGAGTSLAGQVVGNGIVVDVSKYLNKIVQVDVKQQQVRVEPGLVRNALNNYLKPMGLFFAPITSTASRATIGGMIGNNSCGSNSIVYGATRDHLLSVTGFLSDGSEVTFSSTNKKEFKKKYQKLVKPSLENKIYNGINTILNNSKHRKSIEKGYPKKTISRRNTGYALDSLLDSSVFSLTNFENFNFSKLIAGSEGTLMFITEATLNLSPLPPSHRCVVCIHCLTIADALEANIIALKLKPSASELIDKHILDCTKTNIKQSKNRSFIEGDPGAILAVEFTCSQEKEMWKRVEKLQGQLGVTGKLNKIKKIALSCPVLLGEDIEKIWELRAAGLGVMGNIPGDDKPVAVIEDTAVSPEELPRFIEEFKQRMDKQSLSSVYYAHAGAGELHLRPILNLKVKSGIALLRKIGEDMAKQVKRYGGSLSGEHGDGRLRSEFIPQVLGEDNYQLIIEVKKLFDNYNIFNPGKIVDAPLMDENLRYFAGQKTPNIKTFFDFSAQQGIIRANEMCNGTGDCRKGIETGGTMCPSYMASKNERESTRARANILREVLTHSTKANRFDSEEIAEVMQYCLSCKGCKAECPSNVDIAKMKGEFLQQYYLSHGTPLAVRLISSLPSLLKIFSKIPKWYNFFLSFKKTNQLLKKILGFANERNLPFLDEETLRNWYQKRSLNSHGRILKFKKTVYFFTDEFTNYYDTRVGKSAIELLEALGYEVKIFDNLESGRTAISKGQLKKARKVIKKNLKLFKKIITVNTPLIGVEPSCLLTFRDEAIDLLRGRKQEKMRQISKNIFLLEEFLAREVEQGNISSSAFTKKPARVVVHGHCHQKALSSMEDVRKILSLPENYRIEIIPSGCCGMAGSFGYEKKNYLLSMKIANLVLFPFLKKIAPTTLITTSGISCREQIKHGMGKTALHPAEILKDALIK